MEKKNPKITPDLSGAILTKAILEGAIFEGTSFQIATHKGGIFKGDRVEILGVQKTVSVFKQIPNKTQTANHNKQNKQLLSSDFVFV
ncbi:hypothetical protein IH970_13530 [candidate division KSB1 bacterium]|nr:hypothetical protein [candidate division KSB1 bacterium]